MIEPDIDAYGAYARGSALADYLEILAVDGKRCTKAQLEDAAQDRYWTRKRAGMVIPAQEFDEPSTGADVSDTDVESHVEEAFSCLVERADVLGDHYPFELDAHSVRLKSGTVVSNNVYISLLCLTLAQAYRVATSHNLTELFEEIVAVTLEARNFLVARVGNIYRTADSTERSFPTTLRLAGEALTIPTSIAAAPYLRYANDMGADVLTHFPWRDTRRGRATSVWQVTVGNSDSWQRKMSEAEPNLWRKWLQESLDPQCGLAVPHHMPPRTFDFLVEQQGKVVLDRLRLVLSRDGLIDGEAAVIAAVVAGGVENLGAV